ncbi:hypothetical protein ACH4E7_21495 [Kitasatospora sp. NPDC018058]|uniref:hypothetical protein n=1 Tax=Kitasatospora sp. NPDC018058 TaxID=3364025 RepID=UPI0037C074AA
MSQSHPHSGPAALQNGQPVAALHEDGAATGCYPCSAARCYPCSAVQRCTCCSLVRAKAKAREAAAAEAAAPPAAGAPEPVAAPDLAAPAAAAVPAAAVPSDDPWGEDGRYLLSLADALRRKLTAFLEETENGDPVAAFKEQTLRLPGYSSRVFATAQDIRDKARWPDLTESERVSRRLVERIDLWGDDAGSTDDDQDQDGDGSASRGETAAADEDQEQPAPAAPAWSPSCGPTGAPGHPSHPEHTPGQAPAINPTTT